MKKLLLSGTVVALFILFGLLKQQENASGTAQILPPPQNTNNASDTSSGNAIPSQSTPTPTQAPVVGNTGSGQTGQYRDGTYTGSPADAFYGTIQVQAVISGGKITDVTFLQYPSDRTTSVMINQQAMPYLKQEAILAQNAQVNIVSGATDSSLAFRQSLQSALNQAH